MPKTVAIIDDSAFVVQQLKQFLEQKMGLCVVATGNNGSEALEIYKKNKPDLICLDIVMPRRSGQDALDDILKEFPSANVLMVSAVRGDEMLNCMSRGARGYVEKPLRLNDMDFVEELRTTIEEILHIERPGQSES